MPKTTKGAGGGKRHPLNMRTTKETRERLEAAAVANGRSLAQEVEARLESSFIRDDQSEKLLKMAEQMMDAHAHEMADLRDQVRSGKLRDRWEFFTDKNGQHRWRHRDAFRFVLEESEEGYATKEENFESAGRAGYRGEEHDDE